MHIDRLIENTLRNSRLKRVRIKVDPSQLVTHGYEHVSSFEGYVLEESNTSVKVYLMNLPDEFDPVQVVDTKNVTAVPEQPLAPNFKTFKQKVLSYLEKNNIQKDNPVFKQIENANNPEFIETYLKELNFDDKKLLALYKNLLCNEAIGDLGEIGSKLKGMANLGAIQKGAQSFLDNPLYKLGHAAAKTIAGTPGFFIGKNNIIGRIAKFIKTLDVNDLLATDKVKLSSAEYERRPEKDQTVLISFPKTLELPKIPKEKYGDFEYQIKGFIEGSTIREQKVKVTKLKNLSPAWLDREISVSLDFSILNNKEKTGTLIIDFKDRDTGSRYYESKIVLYKTVWIVGVIQKLEDSTGAIGRALAQDETTAAVQKAFESYFNKRPVNREEYDKILNATVSKLIEGDHEKNIEKFDDVMYKLVLDKSAMASMDPLVYLKRYLAELKIAV